ncbi:hypothetical protein ES703_47259 [subsurface metagenome]
MLNPTQEKALRDKLANETEHIGRYQSWVDTSVATIDTYTVKRDEAIEAQKELKKLLFEFTDLIVEPAEVDPGEPVTISVLVENVSSIADSCYITLRIDGVIVGESEITLDSGETRTESQEITRDTPGTYEVDVNNQLGSFVVKGI